MLVVKDCGLDKSASTKVEWPPAICRSRKYWLPAMTNVTSQSDNFWPMKATITDAQALVGRNVLKRLDQMTLKRKQLAMAICKGLSNYSEIIFRKV